MAGSGRWPGLAWPGLAGSSLGRFGRFLGLALGWLPGAWLGSACRAAPASPSLRPAFPRLSQAPLLRRGVSDSCRSFARAAAGRRGRWGPGRAAARGTGQVFRSGPVLSLAWPGLVWSARLPWRLAWPGLSGTWPGLVAGLAWPGLAWPGRVVSRQVRALPGAGPGLASWVLRAGMSARVRSWFPKGWLSLRRERDSLRNRVGQIRFRSYGRGTKFLAFPWFAKTKYYINSWEVPNTKDCM